MGRAVIGVRGVICYHIHGRCSKAIGDWGNADPPILFVDGDVRKICGADAVANSLNAIITIVGVEYRDSERGGKVLF